MLVAHCLNFPEYPAPAMSSPPSLLCSSPSVLRSPWLTLQLLPGASFGISCLYSLVIPLALPLSQACLCIILFCFVWFVTPCHCVFYCFHFSNICFFASFLLQVVLPVVPLSHTPSWSQFFLHRFTLAGHLLFIILFISCYSVLFG